MLIGLQFALVPGGRFWLRCDAEQVQRPLLKCCGLCQLVEFRSAHAYLQRLANIRGRNRQQGCSPAHISCQQALSSAHAICQRAHALCQLFANIKLCSHYLPMADSPIKWSFYWTQELAMVPSTNRHSYGSKIRSLKRKYAARIVNGYRKLPCWRSGYRMAWDDRSGDREAG